MTEIGSTGVQEWVNIRLLARRRQFSSSNSRENVPTADLPSKMEMCWKSTTFIPKSQGGKDSYINLQLLHRHCHDKKTADDAVGTKELEMEWLDANPF